MPDAVFTNRVIIRGDGGRFLSKLRDKERRAAELLAKEAAATARALAPKRTGQLAGSITSTSGASGFSWSVGTDHWEFQEKGTRPHKITGWVNFYWEREGRRWTPGGNWINHPGNKGTHFMERSYEIMKPRIVDTLRTA